MVRRSDVKTDRVGEKFSSKFGTATVVAYRSARDVDVLFDDGTLIQHVRYSHVKDGGVKNPNAPSVYGVGYIGQGSHKALKTNKVYKVWSDMLRRCYIGKDSHPHYKGVTVCKEWHNFQTFADWYEENYYKVGDEIMELDKDLKVKNNKVYSPDTCLIVPRYLNSLVRPNKSNKGKHKGVYQRGVKFSAQVRHKNKTYSAGNFDSFKEAKEAYRKLKKRLLAEGFKEYKDKLPANVVEAVRVAFREAIRNI